MKISNNSIKKYLAYCIALLAFGLLSSSSCDSGLEIPTKKVDIQILDGSNQIVAGADISVYYSEGAFRKDEDAFATGISDDRGKFVVSFPANTEILNYYISVTKGEEDNWYDKIEFYVNDTLDVSETFIQITNTLESQLAGRNGKRWKQTSYMFNGEEFDRCEYRLINIFKPRRFKPESNLNFSRVVDRYESPNSKCNNPDKFHSIEIWELNRERDGFWSSQHEKKFIEFTNTRMITEYFPTNGVRIQETFELEE